MSNQANSKNSSVKSTENDKPSTALTPATPQKPAKKPKRHRNRPDLQNFGAELAEPGTCTKYIRAMRAGLNAPPIDTRDPAAVHKRIDEYLDYCESNDIRPQIVALANWLKVSRDTLRTWKSGDYRADTHSAMIKQVVIGLEALTIDLMYEGAVVPANVIFILKNHYGYKDNQEITIKPPSPLETASSPEEIAAKYGVALPDVGGTSSESIDYSPGAGELPSK